jgi:hypothetical protein
MVLLCLMVLLWWVSRRRSAREAGSPQELFWDGAVQRGLGARERQILLAIVARSGLKRGHEVFVRPDAFDRRVAKLLAECAHDRTPQASASSWK